MSDHEQLHEQREDEADELQRRNEALGDSIDDAKAAQDRLEADELQPTRPAHEGKPPPPEAEYPAKD